ncbi:MAG TPA: hypothetical protein DEQ20_04600 [Desulfobulbaceae bacterium]|nr:MAG: hypothetical protein A2520_11295 [Deltaproteobacteria bacterium RIFOXYD12_FULL_53_23]HCC54194.1 hypothetical protein [Desulfobulbaceae bacterium]
MNTILNRIDRLLMAITFAEANEPELAQEFLNNRKSTRRQRAPQNTPMTGGQNVTNQTAH